MPNIKEQIVALAGKHNAIINQDAIDLLQTQTNFEDLLNEMFQENTFIIDKESVERKIALKGTKIEMAKTEKTNDQEFDPDAKHMEPNFRILDEFDITGESRCEGKIDNFIEMFRDRYTFLKSVLQRREGMNTKPLSRLSRISKGNEVDVIGMVEKKWTSKNGHICMYIEDLEDRCIALILKDDKENMRISERIIMDDVLGFKAVKGGDGMLIVKKVFFPDIPFMEKKEAKRDVSICISGDIHAGSKLFLEKSFQRFIDWLNGKIGDDKEREKVSKIKYLVFAGDNVDGIGIYPNQIDELAIKDIYEQYKLVEDFILQIPEYIEIFICPGQHDAVRRGDPQPAIPEKYVPRLYKKKNIHFISSPGWIEIEGFKILMYHGASIHDLYASVNYLNAKKPQLAIKDLLIRRTLAPTYGKRQPYVPEKKDYMLIREVPDIYIGADMHHTGYEIYKGIIIINSSTWQAQTDFQIGLGHEPTPGIIPVLNLKTRKITENVFYSEDNPLE